MPSKKQALRDALREIDNTYDDQTGRKIPIEERMNRADAALNAGSGKGASTRAENDAAKVNTILKANQSTLEPIRDDIASISNAASQAGDAVRSAKNAYNALKPKFTANAGNYGSKSLIGQAARNLFEFPVFVSTSVPLDYATAVNSLLEQMYASYLQMTISYNPVITAKELAKGKVFQNLKTDITKYVEYTDTFWQHDACHNRIINDELYSSYADIHVISFIALIIELLHGFLYPVLDDIRATILIYYCKRGKFVSSHSADNICAAERIGKYSGDCFDRIIAFIMTKLIIYDLQIIHIRIKRHCFLSPVPGIF